MTPVRGFLLSCCIAGLILAQPAPQKQLTARELFYAAPQAAAAQSRTQPSSVKGSSTKSSKSPKRSATTAAPVEVATAATRPPGTATAPLPAGGAPPLGLRYTVLKLAADGSSTEVPNDTVFRSGDRIRFSVEANDRGYLYVINQGSSGTWKPMFPSAEIEDGDNRVEPIRPYVVPPGKHVFTFAGVAGTENVFIVVSRKPEADLESMIYSLQGKKKATAPDAPVQSSKELIQAVNISNTTIDRMRSAYSRDLIIEKVDPSTPGDKKETAVYVVNPSGSADSHVVADIHLVHQ